MSVRYTLPLLVLTLPFLVQSVITVSRPCNENFGEMWSPSWAPEPRNDLRCRLGDRCKKGSNPVKSEEFDNCCACHSCAVWEGTEIELFIEYFSVKGKSLVLVDQASSTPKAVYKINHIYSDMTEIPSNLCNWDTDVHLNERFAQEFDTLQLYWENIVDINFKNNKIRKINNLNCLVRLDKLDLSNNRLTYISNSSFTDLTRLRSIDLSGNLIQKIDPRILTSVHLNLFHADFSHNKMSELDVSNMLSLYPFCSINFKSNEMSQMVNKANFTLDMSKTYGPGFVSLVGNEVKKFPDFKELLNLDDISQMGHLMSFGFDFRDIPIVCDCNLHSFMSLADDVISVLWRDYMNVPCTGPEDLVGIPVSNVSLDRLICELDSTMKCPQFCTCYDKPDENTLVVNCPYNQGRYLDNLPTLPTSCSKYISLNFSGQHLTNITELYTLDMSMLDVSNNNILEINNDVALALESTTFVDLSNNRNLHQLPKLFLQYRNVCSTNMKNLEIDCNCDTVWIETWLSSKTCTNEDYLFECILPNGENIPALSFTAEDLNCSPEYKYTLEYQLSGTIAFIVLIGTLIYSFRYELLILCVRLKKLGRNSITPKYKYDVFLSFNDRDNNVQKWIDNELENDLISAGYRVFQPSRDVTFGAERDSEILSTIRNSRNFLVVLTDDYLTQVEDDIRPWTENEWKYGWYNFMRDRYKNIVLINFDHVSSFDVLHPQIKAFLRVGCTIDFKNHNRNIKYIIFKELGKIPFVPPLLNDKAFENKNKIFRYDRDFFPKNRNNGVDTNEKFGLDQDTGEAKVQLLTIISDFKKRKPSLDVEANITGAHSSLNKMRCHKKKGTAQRRGHFSCYYADGGFKKTPHIPFFHSNQPSTESFQNAQKIDNLLKLYKLHESVRNIPECKNKHPENPPQNQDKKEHKENYNYEFAKPTATKHQKTSAVDLLVDPRDLEYFEGMDDEDVDDEEDFFRLNMSTTDCESKDSWSTNTDDLESFIGSEYSNTLSTSVGSSRASYRTNSSSGSMTDVSI